MVFQPQEPGDQCMTLSWGWGLGACHHLAFCVGCLLKTIITSYLEKKGTHPKVEHLHYSHIGHVCRVPSKARLHNRSYPFNRTCHFWATLGGEKFHSLPLAKGAKHIGPFRTENPLQAMKQQMKCENTQHFLPSLPIFPKINLFFQKDSQHLSPQTKINHSPPKKKSNK